MNETELSDLMTAPGFFRFLAQEVKLDPEEVKRIYRLGTPWGLWPPDLDLSYETAEAGVDVFTYLAALQPLLDMDTKEKESQLAAYEATLTGGETTQPIPAVRAHVRRWLLYRERTRKPFAAYSMRSTPIASVSAGCL